ncbi:recombinase family protein [Halocatena marina]|uniref:Recombinase family protein n=1 Tax=Halocatena marina TaxID=2934937 RepID=A0ABD5YW04_9EURY|nr:recombinase family protein [Halocatena marina]
MTSERTAVGYVRLSQQSDRSLATQRTDIRDYCTRSGLSLVDVYNEGEGASGYDNDREEYTQMLAYVQEHEIDAVVVRDHARLSRDRKERLRLLLDLDTAGVELHSVERGEAVDLDEDWAYVLQAIQATTDDVEKRKEIERSKQETQRRIAAGCYQGRPPLGTCFDAAGEKLVPDPEEWPTIMDAFELLDDGESYRSINEATGLSLATISRLADRGPDYYHELVETATPAQ